MKYEVFSNVFTRGQLFKIGTIVEIEEKEVESFKGYIRKLKEDKPKKKVNENGGTKNPKRNGE